ncbi:MAG: prolyl oligopeptidase family serine peptidase [Blastocatellales bacterium]
MFALRHSLWFVPPLVLLLAASANTQVATTPAIEIFPDLVYGHKDGLALTLDVVKPKANANGVAIVYLVSSGWFSTYSPPAEAVARSPDLLEPGFTVIYVRHGSSPKYQMPDIVSDVRRAVRFVRHNARRWGVDPNRLGAYGASAGGHLALMLGTASDNGDAGAKEDFLKESNRVAAVVAYYPPVDLRFSASDLLAGSAPDASGKCERYPALNFDRAQAADYSPLLRVSPDDPPTLLIHGDRDELVALKNSQLIYDAFQKNKVKSQLMIIAGAVHGFRGEDAKRANAARVAWFEQTLLHSSRQFD